jgi:hypothetical protein
VVSHASWKIMVAPMIGNVIISKVDALMHAVLSKVEKHMPYGELLGTRECLMDATSEVSYKLRSL